MRFDITPLTGETRRACSAIAQAAMPPSRFALVLVALYALVMVAAFTFASATVTTTFIIGILAVAATAIGLHAEGRRRLRALRRADAHELEPHFVELSAEGVHTGCSHIDARYNWSDFTRTVETQEFYLFIRPTGAGAAVPKRVLDEPSEAQLRECIVQWSPDRGAGLARIVR